MIAPDKEKTLYILAQVGQWPVPAISRNQHEVGDRRRVGQKVSERVFRKQ